MFTGFPSSQNSIRSYELYAKFLKDEIAIRIDFTQKRETNCFFGWTCSSQSLSFLAIYRKKTVRKLCAQRFKGRGYCKATPSVPTHGPQDSSAQFRKQHAPAILLVTVSIGEPKCGEKLNPQSVRMHGSWIHRSGPCVLRGKKMGYSSRFPETFPYVMQNVQSQDTWRVKRMCGGRWNTQETLWAWHRKGAARPLAGPWSLQVFLSLGVHSEKPRFCTLLSLAGSSFCWPFPQLLKHLQQCKDTLPFVCRECFQPFQKHYKTVFFLSKNQCEMFPF